jgi:hypothetical protein
MVMAYFYYRALGNAQLAAIGLLSFAAIAQLAPAFFGGLFWRRATARGAMAACWSASRCGCYTLFLPSFLDGNPAGLLLLQHGPFGIEALRPQALFGADLPPLLHGVLWSLSLNLLTYVVLSLAREPSSIERLQADLFVPDTLAPATPTFRRWRTTVTVQDIESTVAQYLGPERARHSFEAFAVTHNTRLDPAAPGRFRTAAACGAPDRVIDRGGVLAPGDVADAAQAHSLCQGRAQAARRLPRRAAFQS